MRETPKAAKAFNDYADMGAQRSLPSLAEQYRNSINPVPTRQLSRLLLWSQQHGWQARLSAIAEEQRQAIVKRGIADKQHRIDILNKVAVSMERLIAARAAEKENKAAGHDTGLVLVKDVAFVSNDDGEEVTRVEKYATDGVVLKELREYLKQAAIEMGEWTEKREVTGKDGGAIRLTRELTDDELAAIASRGSTGADRAPEGS